MPWAAGRMRRMKVYEQLNWRPQLLVTTMFFLFTLSSSHVGAAEPPDGLTTPPVGRHAASTSLSSAQPPIGSRSFWSLWFDVRQQWRVKEDGQRAKGLLGGGGQVGEVLQLAGTEESWGSVCSWYAGLRGGFRSCRAADWYLRPIVTSHRFTAEPESHRLCVVVWWIKLGGPCKTPTDWVQTSV